MEVFGVDAARAARHPAGVRAASTPSARASPSTRSVTSTSRCRAASRRRVAATRGFTVSGDPSMSIDGGGASARLHHQRDLLGSADRRLPRSVRRPRRHRTPRPARRRPGDVRRRQPARAARAAVRGALRVRARSRDDGDLSRHPPRRSAGGAHLGGDREAAAARARGRRSASPSRCELGVVERLFPELDALVGCPQEPEWHPEGDVWVHTLLVIDQARARIDDLDHPRQVTVMLGAVCHDLGKPATTAFVDGRIRSLDHEEQGVPPTVALLDRLNVHSLHGFDVRRQVLGIVANHLKPGHVRQGAAAGRRRRLPSPRAESGSRAAGARRQGRLRGSRRRLRLLGDGPFRRARARARRASTRRRSRCVKGRHLLELGVAPGPALGDVLREVYERQLDGTVRRFRRRVALGRELARARRLY